MSKDLKNVVIVGASAAGAGLARALEDKLPSTHRIVLIDANEFAFWPISALRAAVVPGWEDKTFKSLQGFFPKGSRHVMLSGTRVVELGNGFVKVLEDGQSRDIAFDISVLALGSTYNFPMRASGSSLADSKRTFVEAQQLLKNAQNNIVIIGGGSVGIEYAGEIISYYPKKKVTIIQSSNRLLNDKYPLKLSTKLQKELESKGVRVVLGQRVDGQVASAGKGNVILKDGSIIDADLIVNASGVTLNTKLVSSYDFGAVNAAGAITVDKNLRIISSNPQSALVTSTYFAIGDCSSGQGGPTAIKAGSEAGAAALNILATLSRSPLKPSPAPLDAIMIPVGPKGGAAKLPIFGTVGPFMTSMAKGKELLVPMFDKSYPASK